MLPAIDISQYQGTWQDYPVDIVMIKMSGGDAGLYFDSQATNNYNQAKAAGKHVGGYHFAGGTDPVAEANYFMRAMQPLAENDVYALDWEIGNPDPVGWCNTFMNTVHNAIGVWPLIYMNLNTLNSYNWDPVLANCGLWLADWAVNPNDNIPTSHTYVMQQYSDGPNYDHDEWFGTLAQFDAYGWHAPQATPAPTPQPSTPTPSPTPTPEPPVTPPTPVTPPPSSGQASEQNTNSTTPNTGTNNTPPVTPKPPAVLTPSGGSGLFATIWQFILNLLKRIGL